MNHFADRLIDAVRRKKTPLCVGLDPRWDSLPESIRRRHGDSLQGKAYAYEEFCIRALDIVAPLVAVVKPQSAFFEACGPAGTSALLQVMRRARRYGLVTVLDAKRNDIASTAEAYAEAAFHVFDADALTVNPYLGRDSIEPFLKVGRALGRGLFVLVRTSNRGGGQFQELSCNNQPLYQQVSAAVKQWSHEQLGTHGYGDVGAVVGATHSQELAAIRQQLPGVLFLVPGFGAQGAMAEDTANAFDVSGLGAIVNSSRAILFPSDATGMDWEAAVENAARSAIRELATKTAAGKLAGT
jgi:orotidine-5'-phosphate decarboxylase